MAEKPSMVAVIALCLSAATAVFSIYQWWSTQQESRINAAIDISKTYLRERDVINTLMFGVYVGWPRRLEDDELLKLARHLEFLNYVAFLGITEKLDRSYLSPALVCEISWADAVAEKLSDRFQSAPKQPNLAAFRKQTPCTAQIASPSVPQPSQKPK